MDWHCTTTEERLSDFLDGALSPEEAAAFSAHTAGCAACTRIVARVGALVSQMQQVPLVEEPAHLVGKILDTTLGPRTTKQSWQQWFGWAAVIWQPRFAMGLATVGASLAILVHAAAPQGGSVSLADLNPVTVARTANRQAHLTYARGAKFVSDLRVVYEIQSRLGAQPEPVGAPVRESQPQPDPPSSGPHDRSEANPQPRHHEAADGSMLAFAVANRWSESLPDRFTRSRP
jgi:anti-sigma factor RsiW